MLSRRERGTRSGTSPLGCRLIKPFTWLFTAVGSGHPSPRGARAFYRVEECDRRRRSACGWPPMTVLTGLYFWLPGPCQRSERSEASDRRRATIASDRFFSNVDQTIDRTS